MSRRSHRGGRPHPGGARPGRSDAPRHATSSTGSSGHAPQGRPLPPTAADASAEAVASLAPEASVEVLSVEAVEVAGMEAGADLVVASVQVAMVSHDLPDEGASAVAAPVEPTQQASGLAPDAPVAGIETPSRNDQDRVRPAGPPANQRPRQPGPGRGPAPRPGDRRPPDGGRPPATVGPGEDGADNGNGAMGRGGSGCTGPQLKRFIKSRVYVPMHELRRRFQIEGNEDDVVPVTVGAERVYVGLPEREGRLLGELLRGGDVGYELSMDPPTPIVVGVYPMRPIPRG